MLVEEVSERRRQQARNDEIYIAELNPALREAESDFKNKRYVEGFEEAWKKIVDLRGQQVG